MVTSCSAYGCTNRQQKGVNISFHKFPNDSKLLKNWLVAMKREGFKPTIHSKICSEHFHQGNFIYNFGRKTLNHDSVPSIFNFPAHLLKKDPNERSKRLQTVSSKGVSSSLSVSGMSSASASIENVVSEIKQNESPYTFS